MYEPWPTQDNPTIARAIWIRDQMPLDRPETADDVYDVLLGNITRPYDFVQEVRALSNEYGGILNAKS